MRDFLPSERVLATQYVVSRNVIREAIKILTEKKLVTNVIGKAIMLRFQMKRIL